MYVFIFSVCSTDAHVGLLKLGSSWTRPDVSAGRTASIFRVTEFGSGGCRSWNPNSLVSVQVLFFFPLSVVRESKIIETFLSNRHILCFASLQHLPKPTSLWRWRQYVPPKCRNKPNVLLGSKPKTRSSFVLIYRQSLAKVISNCPPAHRKVTCLSGGTDPAILNRGAW